MILAPVHREEMWPTWSWKQGLFAPVPDSHGPHQHRIFQLCRLRTQQSLRFTAFHQAVPHPFLRNWDLLWTDIFLIQFSVGRTGCTKNRHWSFLKGIWFLSFLEREPLWELCVLSGAVTHTEEHAGGIDLYFQSISSPGLWRPMKRSCRWDVCADFLPAGRRAGRGWRVQKELTQHSAGDPARARCPAHSAGQNAQLVLSPNEIGICMSYVTQ